MALKTDAYYRHLAEQALRQAGMEEPPISMFELAGKLGVPVREVRLPAWFTGAIVSEDGMPVILVNLVVPEPKRLKALAHMLAHVVLVLGEPDGSYPRNTVPEHRLADIMGEELMLPTFAVCEEARKWFNDYRYLARLFGVGENMMLDRMRDLGLIKVRGIYWDY